MIQGITYTNTLVILSLFIGFSLSLSLLFKQSSKSRANIFLALILLSYTLHLLPGYLYGARLLEDFPHAFRIGSLFNFAVGPLIWLYVLACTQKSFEMRRLHWLHFIPFVLDVCLSIPYLMLDGTAKYQLFLEFIETGQLGRSRVHDFLSTIHPVIYSVLSWVVVLRYRKHINETSSSIDLTYHRWLLLFSSILIVPILAGVLFSLDYFEGNHINIILIGITFLAISVYVALLLKPELFHKFPNQVEVISVEEQEKQKYEKSNLQESKKEKLVQKLLEHVKTEKPYQSPELTLTELANQVAIPTHYLSQIINEKIQQSFLEFINSYRVEAAKSMLTSKKYDHYTILAVAFEAGFNSKSAFYTAFKKFTNTTPSKYRKSFSSNELERMSA